MPAILITGGGGQVGLELQRAELPSGWRLIVPPRDALDLARPDSVRDALDALAFDAVINAAAYTAVDKAESEPGLAFAINRDGAAALAEAAAARGVAFVQLSTDYVFSGEKPAPYTEDDEKSPVSAYGRSKAEGEDAVSAAHPHCAIVRTSWVYSPFRANFVKTMLRVAATRDEVGVVADQIGKPTAAADLAHACLAVAARLLDRDAAACGIFHYADGGEASWADFAEAIFAEAVPRGFPGARVKRIATADYPTAARRPANSRLDTRKIETVLGIAPRAWPEALARCMSELAR